MNMQRLLSAAVALVLTAFYANAQIRVSYDYDQDFDFNSIKTYAFVDAIDDVPVNDIVRKEIIQAIETQLMLQGFTESDNPDVLIGFNVKVEEKQTESTVTDYYGARYYRYYWGPSFSTSRVVVSDYLEGTLFVDIIDAAAEQLVWQGRAVGVVTDYKKPEQRQKRLDKALKKVFRQFPNQ